MTTANDGHLQAGETLPDFALPDASGNTWRPSDLQGRITVLYVYPKDDTPGCTREACAFRDAAELRELGVQILGLSRDDAASHAKFSEKYGLPFPLLSDESGEFLRKIGAYGTIKRYGREHEGVKRMTFILDENGKLIKSWRAVKVDGHTEAVLKAVKSHLEGK